MVVQLPTQPGLDLPGLRSTQSSPFPVQCLPFRRISRRNFTMLTYHYRRRRLQLPFLAVPFSVADVLLVQYRLNTMLRVHADTCLHAHPLGAVDLFFVSA